MTYTQAAVWGVGITFPVIGFLLVVVRFWMRRGLQKTPLGIDDWTILFASIIVLAMAACSIIGTYLGTMAMDGQPTIDSHLAAQSKLNYVTLVIEKPGYGAIKLSVLFFYRRIFTLGRFRIINDIMVGVIVAWTLAFFFADIFNCGADVSANWDPKAKETAHCINLFILLLVFAVTDVVTDMAILWMPYPQIKKLQMSLRERWVISGVFMLGLLDLFIGIVRMGFVIAGEYIPATKANFNPPIMTAPTFWTIVEVGIGVIAANLPALAPLYKHRAKLMSSFSSFTEKLLTTRTSKSGSRNDSLAPTAMTSSNKSPFYSSPESGEILVEPQRSNREDSVGAWHHFERMDEMSSAEESLGSRRTPDDTIV